MDPRSIDIIDFPRVSGLASGEFELLQHSGSSSSQFGGSISSSGSGSGLEVISSGSGPNLHVIANIDYGFMLESINEEDESPKRKRKRKKKKKLKGIWSAEWSEEQYEKYELEKSDDEDEEEDYKQRRTSSTTQSSQSSEDETEEVTSCIEILRPVNKGMIAEMEAKSNRDDSSTRSPTPTQFTRTRSYEDGLNESEDGGRESRSYSRASTWKRRDDSWDKKWSKQLAKNEDELPRASIFSKTYRSPGRIDNSVWETRAASSEIQLKGLPPRTPQPSPMTSRRRITPSPVPRPSKNLPRLSSDVKEREPTPPFPSPPSKFEEKQEEPFSPPLPLPPSPLHFEASKPDQTGSEKDEEEQRLRLTRIYEEHKKQMMLERQQEQQQEQQQQKQQQRQQQQQQPQKQLPQQEQFQDQRQQEEIRQYQYERSELKENYQRESYDKIDEDFQLTQHQHFLIKQQREIEEKIFQEQQQIIEQKQFEIRLHQQELQRQRDEQEQFILRQQQEQIRVQQELLKKQQEILRKQQDELEQKQRQKQEEERERAQRQQEERIEQLKIDEEERRKIQHEQDQKLKEQRQNEERLKIQRQQEQRLEQQRQEEEERRKFEQEYEHKLREQRQNEEQLKREQEQRLEHQRQEQEQKKKRQQELEKQRQKEIQEHQLRMERQQQLEEIEVKKKEQEQVRLKIKLEHEKKKQQELIIQKQKEEEPREVLKREAQIKEEQLKHEELQKQQEKEREGQEQRQKQLEQERRLVDDKLMMQKKAEQQQVLLQQQQQMLLQQQQQIFRHSPQMRLISRNENSPSPTPSEWKAKMQEELNRARSLLRCSESVESVIQLLDQTFERLQSDVAAADLSDARENVKSSQTITSQSSSYFTQEQSVCSDSFSQQIYKDSSQSPNSRRRSGMYTAVPVFIDAEPEQADQTKMTESKSKTESTIKSEMSDKVSLERKSFLQSMLKSSSPSFEPKSAEINVNQSQTKALEESTLIKEQKEKEEEEKRLRQEMRKRAHDKHTEEQKMKIDENHSTVSDQIIKNEEKAELFTSDKSNNEWGKSKIKMNGHDAQFTKETHVICEPDSRSSTLSRRDTYRPSSVQHTPRGKLYPFEAPQKEQGFTISGMWSNVNLGLVKERSDFWQKKGKKSKNMNRQSRLIDPNEWVTPLPNESSITEPQNLRDMSKNKFLSSGNLVADVEVENLQATRVVSSAMVAIEKRADGRKSADIFLPSNYGHKMSQVNKHRESDRRAKEVVTSQHDKEVEGNMETEIVRVVDKKVEEGQLASSESYNKELEMEEILLREKEKQKLIQKKLKEIEEQNEILAQLEARERKLSQEKQVQDEQEAQIEIELCQQIENAFKEFEDSESTPNEIPTKNEEEEVKMIKDERRQLKEVKVTTTDQITTDCPQYQKSHVEENNLCQETSNQEKQPPQVPWRSSSKHIVKERSYQGMQSPQPGFHLVNVSVSPAPSSSRLSASPSTEILSPNIVQQTMMRAREFEIAEKQEREKEEAARKEREQEEQERRFYQKMLIEQQWKQKQSEASSRQSPVSGLDDAGHHSGASKTHYEKNAIQRLRKEEVKEFMKLKEMERKRKEIDEEIEREKRHLFGLKQLEQEKIERAKHAKIKPKAAFQYEDMVEDKMGRTSSPPPVPPPPIPPPPNPETLQRLSQSYPHEEYVTIQLQEPFFDPQNDVPPQPSCPSYLEELQKVEHSPAPIKPEIVISEEPTLPANPNIITASVNPSIETFKTKSVTPPLISKTVQLTKPEESLTQESKPSFGAITPRNQLQRRSSPKPATVVDSAPVSVVTKPFVKPKSAVEEVREAGVAVKDVAQVLIRALKDEASPEEKIPDGVVKSAKSSLEKDREKVGVVKRSNGIEEELKEIAGEGKVKKTASAYNLEAKAKISQAEAAKAVPPSRKIAQLFKAEFRKWSDDSDDETDGYSEGAEDLSSGFELPPMPDFRKDLDEQSSGNVTPIPTQGELGEISTEEPDPMTSEGGPRSRTPLKSLLKKQSIDVEEYPEPQCVSDSEVDGRESPKKTVHFSEIDQIKLMSLESLVSSAPSETSTTDSMVPFTSIMMASLQQHPYQAGHSTQVPNRNQVTSYPPCSQPQQQNFGRFNI